MNTVLFVFGMGRSGSSALTRVLSLCGGTLPTELIGATEGNPLGHWEPVHALVANEVFLHQYGANWFDPTLRLQGEVEIAADRRAAYMDKIKAFLAPFSSTPLLLIKEPRITALASFWFEAASQLGMSIKIVIPVRHPAEVVASLAARDGACPELSSALWLKYSLLGERESRAYPRVFVEYASLLRDWRTEVTRISGTLAVELCPRSEVSVDQFLRQDLHRQRNCGKISEVFGVHWISRVYEILLAATRNEPVNTAALEEIFRLYCSYERTFRVALDDFRNRFAMEEAVMRASTDRSAI